jgi:hypothetical protein
LIHRDGNIWMVNVVADCCPIDVKQALGGDGAHELTGGSPMKKPRIWQSASKEIGTANHAEHANVGGGS